MGKKMVLSCDGGGIRGIISLYFLLHLEEDLFKLTGKTIYETFDVFSGNSVGSVIIGSIIYLIGPDKKYKRMSDLVNVMYTDDNFKEIFTRNRNPLSKLLLRPKYDSRGKTNLLKKYLKDVKLTDTEKKVMFPVYSISEQRPKFYKSYTLNSNSSSNSSSNRSSNNYVREEESYYEIMDEEYNKINTKVLARNIIDASSAAPAYFSSITYDSDEEERTGIDGAVCSCNNPSDSIFADALQLYPKEDITILSIGTGSKTEQKRSKETRKWGLFQWAMSGIGDIILNSNETTADYKTRHFAHALGHKYLRIQEPVNIALDDISKIDELKLIGKAWYLKHREEVLKLFVEEKKEKEEKEENTPEI